MAPALLHLPEDPLRDLINDNFLQYASYVIRDRAIPQLEDGLKPVQRRILPHNFIELLKAQIAILENKRFKLVPDFPQGGLMDASEYDKGNGKVKLRAKIEKREPNKLVIREL